MHITSRAYGIFAAASLALAGLSATPAAAGHNIFHIFTPAVEAGAWGAEALSAFHAGLPPASEHASVRAAHELAVHTGVNDLWMTKLALGIERPAGGDYEVTSIASENVFRFTPKAHAAVDAAWFTAIEAGVASDAANAVVFGPIVSVAQGPVAVMLNPFFEKTFGRNREDGVAFAYGWRATYQISDALSFGVEGYGAVENLGNAPPVSDQVHRVGPVLYFGHVHGNPDGIHGPEHTKHGHAMHDAEHHGGKQPEWHGEFGILFGLTDATPDAAIKFNIGADF